MTNLEFRVAQEILGLLRSIDRRLAVLEERHPQAEAIPQAEIDPAPTHSLLGKRGT